MTRNFKTINFSNLVIPQLISDKEKTTKLFVKAFRVHSANLQELLILIHLRLQQVK